MNLKTSAAAIVIGLFVFHSQAVAQTAQSAVAVHAGHAAFVDDRAVHHGVIGAGYERSLSPRIAVGPELLYMVGPGNDRDLFVWGVARFGFRPLDSKIAPYAIAGGGLMVHEDKFHGVTFRTTEGSFVAGGGVRFQATPRMYVAPEVSFGWELHLRSSVSIGFRF